MKLLAIDTSTELATVALQVNDELLSAEQGSQKTHAQLLLPMIDRLMVDSGVSMSQLDGIVFGCGPGSFTGLRIACSIAKGLAYAHNLQLTPVSSLDAIAYAVRQKNEMSDASILAVLDARMHEMYWSFFSKEQYIGNARVDPVKSIELSNQSSIILAGVGIDLYWPDFTDAIKTQVVNKLTIYPHAAAMIQLAQKAQIQPVSVAQAQPVYVRNQVTQGDSRG